MKPMGLTDPRTGRRPYAVVQLRQENLRADSYNLVGFQNHMRFPEQARVFRMIPGSGARRISALRSDSPQHLYQCSRAAGSDAPAPDPRPGLFRRTNLRAWKATWNRSLRAWLQDGTPWSCWQSCAEIRLFPRETAIGSLCAYVSGADARNYQPANITFDLLPALDEPTRLKFRHDKKARHAEVCRRALEKLDEYRALWLVYA